MEKAKLEEFNHWWARGRVDPDLALPFRRDMYKEIEEKLKSRFILALAGLRRVGKTTLIYQIIEKLIEEKTAPQNILFFSFDEASASISEILDAYKEVHRKDLREERVYVFLDEIQKYPAWENELKKYYDLYPKLKFMISGSESLFIKKKTKETLAGRIFEFIMTPFTFNEYLRFNKVKEEDFRYETKIKPLFLKFMERGGFPETFAFENAKEFKEYVKALVVDKIVYKDIPKIFRIEDPDFLAVLLELVTTNPGMYIDYQSLSRQFGKDRRVVKDYLFYLKESFLITLLGNYRKGSITTLRKKKKAYPADNALIYLYKPQIGDDFFGRMVETAAVNRLKARSFWKNRGEVDVIHDGIPIEIKYQENIKSEDFRSLKEFMRKFGRNRGILITKKEENELKFDYGSITLVPAWKWMLG